MAEKKTWQPMVKLQTYPTGLPNHTPALQPGKARKVFHVTTGIIDFKVYSMLVLVL